MLATSKSQLIAAMKKDAVDLQNLELQYFFQNNAALATQASVLAGFSFSGLLLFNFGDDVGWKHLCFYTSCSFAMGFNLLTVLLTTSINIVASGVALTGPEGSMMFAVDTMRTEQVTTMTTFCLGIIFFHLSGIAYASIEVDPNSAKMCVVVVLFAFLGAFFIYCAKIYHTFNMKGSFLSVRGVYQESDLLSSLEESSLLERGDSSSSAGGGHGASGGVVGAKSRLYRSPFSGVVADEAKEEGPAPGWGGGGGGGVGNMAGSFRRSLGRS